MNTTAYAISKCKHTPYKRGYQRIYAVITDKRGRILSEGSNLYNKSHPMQAKFAKKVGRDEAIFLHAEISALIRLQSVEKAHKITIVRLGAKDESLAAKPCPSCELAIKASGIKYVEYSI